MCSWSELVKISTQRQLEKTIWCFLARDSHRNRLDVSWPETDKKKINYVFPGQRQSQKSIMRVWPETVREINYVFPDQIQLKKSIWCFLARDR